MARNAKHILDIVLTDSTFAIESLRDGDAWVGRCIFCSRKLVVSREGAALSPVSVEHIVPRSHGGTDQIENLALACPGCNQEKGMRHDARRKGDPRLAEIIASLQARRRERWR